MKILLFFVKMCIMKKGRSDGMGVQHLIIPKHYENKLSILETEVGIKYVKDYFEKALANHLNLMRISAPLYVEQSTGLNDDLSGIERPVSFDMKDVDASNMQIVHSLAKWKRVALHRYEIETGKGIYTDMNAIRRDEVLDNLHSAYVDQWDWEKVILPSQRTLSFLKETVHQIVRALKETEEAIHTVFPNLQSIIHEDVYFLTTQELENMYPHLTSKQREYEIVKQYKTVCLMQIGDQLQSGEKHDDRAPDYDDWKLNADILIYYPILDCAVEISSMGIRVDAISLQEQLKKACCEHRLQLPYHQMVVNHTLPLTIGGGIGQSRICLLLLNKAHIGEVQVSQWQEEMREVCAQHQMYLL